MTTPQPSPAAEPPRRSAQLLRFTTQGLNPEARVQLWEGHNARALIPLDIRTLDASPMRSAQTNLHLPSIRMADVSGTSQIVERSESFINDNPTDLMAVFFALEGDAFFFHRGGQLVLQPGQAVVYDADLPFTRGFSRGLREVVLTIPKPIFEESVGRIGRSLPTVIDFGDGPGAGTHARSLARLLRTTMTALADPSRVSAPDLATVESEVLALLRLILAGPGSSAGGLVASAKDVIERNLSNPDLSPGMVAAAVGVSERQLGRYFSEADTTVGRHIQARRVALAADLLASPEHEQLSVADIAARAGFASQSHFGRVFRRYHEVTPLQFRKNAARQRFA